MTIEVHLLYIYIIRMHVTLYSSYVHFIVHLVLQLTYNVTTINVHFNVHCDVHIDVHYIQIVCKSNEHLRKHVVHSMYLQRALNHGFSDVHSMYYIFAKQLHFKCKQMCI